VIELTAARMSRDVCRLLLKNSKGRIHSVFDSAVNIQMCNGGLITVLAAGRCLCPRSVSLAENVVFTSIGLKQDSCVSFSSHSIQLSNKAIINIKNAELISLSIPKPSVPVVTGNGEYEARMAVLASVLNEAENMAEGIAPVLCDMFGICAVEHNVWSGFLVGQIRSLYEILRSRDVLACAVAGRSVAGCGPGLTPASDDFLVGVFASLYGASTAGILPRKTAIRLCRGLSEGAIPATGIISAAFLGSGARGYFSEDIVNLIFSFFCLKNSFSLGDKEKLTHFAGLVCSSGSTSGVDTLAGIWFGLAACCPPGVK